MLANVHVPKLPNQTRKPLKQLQKPKPKPTSSQPATHSFERQHKEPYVRPSNPVADSQTVSGMLAQVSIVDLKATMPLSSQNKKLTLAAAKSDFMKSGNQTMRHRTLSIQLPSQAVHHP